MPPRSRAGDKRSLPAEVNDIIRAKGFGAPAYGNTVN